MHPPIEVRARFRRAMNLSPLFSSDSALFAQKSQGWQAKATANQRSIPPHLSRYPISGVGPRIQLGVIWSDIGALHHTEARLTEGHGYHATHCRIPPQIKDPRRGSTSPDRGIPPGSDWQYTLATVGAGWPGISKRRILCQSRVV